ncbi:MAG: polysaccharide biosynthesis/export family protein [Muribaculum sp.]|nr:polysaccharide biosynthesis/export family protein [Muribaculum sp.]
MKRLRKQLIGAVAFTAMALMITGCTPKNVTYMQDIDENLVSIQSQVDNFKVEPGDKISIIVHSKDPNLAALFNLPVVNNQMRMNQNYNGGSTQQSFDTDGLASYTVSSAGTIDFPVLGPIKISGMTRQEVSAFIKGELIGRNLVKDPTVTVEFLNAGVTIMGDVKNPGRYNINRDNLNILEALALAGDLDITANRQTVKVIRHEDDGTVHSYMVDLTNGKKMMSSPAFYLHQNDVIYVEPNGVKKRQATVNGNTALSASFWVSVASLLTSVAVLIFK